MRRVAALAGAALLLAGCSSMGPPTIARDRFDYVSSISESWKKQMLLNVVKVRYSDAPVFLDVTSVINAYGLEGTISLVGQTAPIGREGDSFANLGANARYSDHPTITYVPLSGDKFARSVMTPIPVNGILSLVEGGYPVDVVLRFCANSINDLDNSRGGVAGRSAGDDGFRELLELLREEQSENGAPVISGDKRSDFYLYLRRPRNAETRARQGRIVELLGLQPGRMEYRIRYGVRQDDRTEVAIQSRSMLQVLGDFASYVDVPAADVADGRAFPVQRTAEELSRFPPLVAVRSGASAPDSAYVSVHYRGKWFWISDRDYRSKGALSFLMLMFSLTDSDTSAAAPILTVPTR
ncbi:MAG: hypothetical protein ACREVQ_13015 [Burkholderiales bacterium]